MLLIKKQYQRSTLQYKPNHFSNNNLKGHKDCRKSRYYEPVVIYGVILPVNLTGLGVVKFGGQKILGQPLARLHYVGMCP